MDVISIFNYIKIRNLLGNKDAPIYLLKNGDCNKGCWAIREISYKKSPLKVVPSAGFFDVMITYIVLLCVAHRPGFPDYGDLDLTRVRHFALDPFGEVE